MEQSKYRPSKKLLDHVARLIKGKPEYVLLDEQLVVYDKVVEAAMEGIKGKKKVAIIVRGEIVGSRGAVQVRYFNSYMGADVNVIDVMIADEAHRIRETSNNRFTPKIKQSKLPQIQELLKASRTSVFFIDDNQVVRPGEIGSVQYIKEEAEKLHCDVSEFELEAQFRCAGSDAFVSWINNTLGIQRLLM